MGRVSETHEYMVGLIVEKYEAATILFRRRVLQATDSEPDELEWFIWKPDAYLIEPETQTLKIWEVAVGSPPTDDRIRQYARLWMQLDYYDWTVELTVVDRYGHMTPIDLMFVYSTLIDEYVAEKRAQAV